MARLSYGIPVFLSLWLSFLTMPSFAAPPKVVTTIAPLQSIAANVMQGVGTPKALLQGPASPHSYALKPSDAKTLSEADLVVWIGPSLEGFAAKAIKTLGKKARIIELLKEKDLLLLDSRDGDGHHEHEGSWDPHLWLSTVNGEEIANILAVNLAEMDPANAQAYFDNARKFRQTLDKVRRRLEVKLRSYATVPFMTYHDGFQYFERGFSLSSKGYVTLSPERPIGAKRATLIRAAMSSNKVRCLFLEPQFQPKLATTLTEGTGVRTAVIDPLGADIPIGVDFYPTLIGNLGNAIAACLSGKP